MKRNRVMIIICAVLAALFLLGLIVPVIADITANAASLKEQLNSLKTQQSELSARQKEIRTQINELSDQITDFIKKKQLLDMQIDLTEQELDNVNAQIDVIAQEIIEKEVEYANMLLEEKTQVQIFKERVREMEENGSISYFAILFNARSFSDLLSRLDFINEIMHYDEGVVEKLDNAKQRSALKRSELEDIQSQAELYRVLQNEKMAEHERQLKEAEEMCLELENQRGEAEAIYDELLAEKGKLDEQVNDTVKKIAEEAERERLAREAALRAQQTPRPASQSSRIDSIVSTGTYIWPTTSYTITEYYGIRDVHPVTGKRQTPHNGIDIGAGYGANVYAADSGEVLKAEYNAGYGNYILLAHGNGRYTAYAHMSKYKVKAGDKVTQGQVIGLVGSTGNSTGPHLHFETLENSVRVDPMKYFKS